MDQLLNIASNTTQSALYTQFLNVRQASIAMCSPLQPDDFGAQPVEFVSPPKWNLAHTTWFFEEFILQHYASNYSIFHPQYKRLFNSYYEAIGQRLARNARATLTRPTVDEVYAYRAYVDKAMGKLLTTVSLTPQILELLELGLNHEQQHQELFFSEIKYILGHNPLFPAYSNNALCATENTEPQEWLVVPEGIYSIGHHQLSFAFDNELPFHKVYLANAKISNILVTNADYLDFMADGGYRDFRHWHSEGWQWVQQNQAQAPLYWHFINGQWMEYTLAGLHPLVPNQQLVHVNYFEASAFAQWQNKRLPTEFEWEAIAPKVQWGSRWEWTDSAYRPYPGYTKAQGAVGEYNGKFMVNQTVLRGASVATPKGHERLTYRNFWHTHHNFQFSGIRLAQSI